MKSKENKPSAVFKVGTVSLAFLVIGYQTALFVNHAAVARIVANRDRPDTVFVYAGSDSSIVRTEVRGTHSASAERIYGDKLAAGGRELFRFDPNTVSSKDLQRLGFTQKQAASIVNYREKGGRFRRKSDFARSYVVSEDMFARLEPYIDIPLLDINRADSAAFDALPGVGPHFASKMVSYREELGGYSYPEQLMDIWNFGEERYEGLSDLICCGRPEKAFALWTLPADSLKIHPYIRKISIARAIVLYRENTPESERSVMGLAAAGIIPDSVAVKLSRCFISDADAVSGLNGRWAE